MAVCQETALFVEQKQPITESAIDRHHPLQQAQTLGLLHRHPRSKQRLNMRSYLAIVFDRVALHLRIQVIDGELQAGNTDPQHHDPHQQQAEQ